MIKRAVSLISVLILIVSLAHGQDYNMYESGSYVNKQETLPYRILFPENFNPEKKYPVIFILHDLPGRGDDNKAQLKNGASLFLQIRYREKFPAIVVFPQCPKDDSWSNRLLLVDNLGREREYFQQDGYPTGPMRLLMGCVDEFLKKPFVDLHKVYVGGMGNGGMGTFEILWRKPDVFAAAFAICGGGNAENARAYAKKVPLWIFHGEKDEVVPPKHSEAMVVALKGYGANPKFTLYTNDGHNCWDDAFAEPDLLPWLFGNSK